MHAACQATLQAAPIRLHLEEELTLELLRWAELFHIFDAATGEDGGRASGGDDWRDEKAFFRSLAVAPLRVQFSFAKALHKGKFYSPSDALSALLVCVT